MVRTEPRRAGHTGAVPPALRSRLALIVLLAVFLIPVGLSSLRGLTHVVTCRAKAEIPFTIVTPERGRPTIISAAQIERGAQEGVCGGLVLDLAVTGDGERSLAVTVPLTNTSEDDWRGTVQLRIGGATVPVDIGRVPAGETRVDRLAVAVRPGTLELDGSVLIGP